MHAASSFHTETNEGMWDVGQQGTHHNGAPHDPSITHCMAMASYFPFKHHSGPNVEIMPIRFL